MQVNNINNSPQNPSFGKFYILPKTEENISKLECCLKPYYLRKQQIAFNYIGKNPLDEFTQNKINLIANKNGGNMQWLKLNAEQYGIIIPDINLDVITIITSNRDVIDFRKYIAERFKINNNIFIKLKNIITNKAKLNPYSPRHINELKAELYFYNTEVTEFDKFLSNKEVKKVSCLKELFREIMKEEV